MQQCDRGHYGLVIRQNSVMMNEEDEGKVDDHPSTKSESEEEDYESFFLQPASSPYNIQEKIVEANKLLEKDSHDVDKQIRVKFRDELVDFEPDLTDDDVQSIESYTEEVIEELKYVIQDKKLCDIEEEIIEESIIESIIELNHQHKVAREENNDLSSSLEETEEVVEHVEEIEEEIEELVESFQNIKDIDDISEVQEFENFEEVLEDLPQPPEEVILAIEEPASCQEDPESSSLKGLSKKIKISKKKKLPHEINCKKHCIEQLESRLECCINNLRVSEKPICPTLRLHRQKCCSQGCKLEQKLPLYTGMHSEYGLSSSQIQRLTKQKELIKLKEEKERELTAAYKLRRIQQNEIIFRQWLRDITTRKQAEKEREKIITGRNYSVSTRRGVKNEKHSEQRRPRTANCITSVQLRLDGRCGRHRTRPHTTSSSTARIFIEIPKSLLNDGFSLGELFIKNQQIADIRLKGKGHANRLHMVAVSSG